MMWVQVMPSSSSSAWIAIRCSAIRLGPTRSDLVATATRVGRFGSLAISPTR